MPERVEAWWARRQWSKSAPIPYPVGTYRDAWQSFPVLVRQFHPELNGGITLTQVPPAADVYLLWLCDAGHHFVATPTEQRERPGRTRRRSSWCTECAAGATLRKPRSRPAAPSLCSKSTAEGHAIGAAFSSACAPKPASAAESLLRQKLASRLVLTDVNAVRVGRPFFAHLEVWPDILLPDLRVAIEYDTTGRDGLEHVGKREVTDRRKDALLRSSRWEVVRVRGGRLPMLGRFDLSAGAISGRLVDRIIDQLRLIRGDLIVDAYLREREGG